MRSRRGYTVLELMTAIAIIGLLAGIAVNLYTAQQMRSKRAEAWEGLSAIESAQQYYYTQHDSYNPTFNNLDFDIEGGRRLSLTSYQGARYVYQLSQPWGSKSYYCIATANLDEDSWPDILEVYDTGDGS